MVYKYVQTSNSKSTVLHFTFKQIFLKLVNKFWNDNA